MVAFTLLELCISEAVPVASDFNTNPVTSELLTKLPVTVNCLAAARLKTLPELTVSELSTVKLVLSVTPFALSIVRL